MNPENVRFVKANLKTHKYAILNFMVKNFANNPLQALLPVPVDQLAHICYLHASENLSVLAFYGDQLIGCLTGSKLTYEEILKVHKISRREQWALICPEGVCSQST